MMKAMKNSLFLFGMLSFSFVHAVELTPLPPPPSSQKQQIRRPGYTPPQYLIQFNQRISPLTCLQLATLHRQFVIKHNNAKTTSQRAYYGQHRTIIDQWMIKKRC